MARRAMSAEQLRRYEQFEHSLDDRDLPPDVRSYLLVLREHLLVCELAGATLARRAAAREPRPAPGRAAVGHDKKGQFSAQRLSEELNGRDRLPREALVEVVADAYAEVCGEAAAAVRRRLLGLRRAAVSAAGADKERRQEQAQADGRRGITYTQHAQVRAERDTAQAERDTAQAERDTARGERDLAQEERDTARAQRDRVEVERDEVRDRLGEAEQQLAGLQQRYQDLAAVDVQRARTVEELHARIGELLGDAERLRGELADRDRAVADQERALGERERALDDGRAHRQALEQQTLTLRAEVDQLTAATEELRRRLDTAHDPTSGDTGRGGVREGLVPDSPDSSGSAAEPVLSWDDNSVSAPDSGSVRPRGAADPAGAVPRPLPGPLVPGVDDSVVAVVLDDLQQGRFDPRAAAARYPAVPRHVVLHLCGAALSLGLLLLPRGTRSWRAGRSGVPEPDVLFGPMMTGFVLVMAGLATSFGGLVWSRWTPALLLFAAGLAAAACPRTRRWLPSPVFAGVPVAAVVEGVFAPAGSALGWSEAAGSSATGVVVADVVAAVGMLAAAGFALRPLARARRVERFYDEVARFQATEVQGAGATLQRHILERVAHRDTGHGTSCTTSPGGTADPDYTADRRRRADTSHADDADGPAFTITLESPATVRATFRCGKCSITARSSRPPSVIRPQPRPVTRLPYTAADLREATAVFPPAASSRVTWLWADGEYVHQGDPVAVSYRFNYCNKCRKSYLRMSWTSAPVDGVLVLRGERYDLAEARPRTTALVVPSHGPRPARRVPQVLPPIPAETSRIRPYTAPPTDTALSRSNRAR